jgi:hypothetical protein
MVPNAIRRWRRWLRRIWEIQIAAMDDAQHLLIELDGCLERAARSDRSGLAWEIQWGAIARLALAIRRAVEDERKGRRRKEDKSLSLVILLRDLSKNTHLLTRDRFKGMWRNKALRDRFADRDFNEIVRSPRANNVTCAQIEKDIVTLKRSADRARRFVNKILAHTTRDRRRIGKTRVEDLDDPVEEIKKVFVKYECLITGSSSTAVPTVRTGPSLRSAMERLWPPKKQS